MKKLLTLLFVFSALNIFAQDLALNSKRKSILNVCVENGHSLTYSSPRVAPSPYRIDSRDSTITVYPAPSPMLAKCTRCGAEVLVQEKETRVTTWRRVDLTTNSSNVKNVPAQNTELVSYSLPETVNPTPKKVETEEYINWGRNTQRAKNAMPTFSNLNEIKKVATLKQDTLFIHKRVEPFNSIKEQSDNRKTRTVIYNNKAINFKVAIFDEAAFYAKKGTAIY